jgi:Mn2+/Fe2+ NRAMP family transporter
VLKWLTLSLFAYVATVFVVKVPWAEVGEALIAPSLSFKSDYIVAVVAVLGTTISPYLFFWQAAEEVEDEEERPGSEPLKQAPDQAPAEISRIRIDTYLGMALSNLIALFIIITTAATLHAHGIVDIQTSSQAAEALRPIAGNFAFAVFAAGIIGTGLLTLPVLAGSAAYALGEARGWPVGLARQPMQAKAFYGAIAAATIVGAIMNFTPIDPIKALFWSAVVNGVAAAPVMAMMMILTMRRDIMGTFILPRTLQAVGWLATVVKALTIVAMAATAIR